MLDEFEKAVAVETEFFSRLAETFARKVRLVTSAPEAVPAGTPMMQRILGAIERGGNKMPNPAILFVWLCVIVIVLSALLAWADIKVTYQVVEPPPITVEETVPGGSTQPSGGLPDASVQEGEYTVREETAAIQSLLSADGIRFLFTSFVANFRNFAAVAIILVVMLGVGLAEAAGLIGALIRKLVKVSSEAMLTPILVFIGVLSSIASDAGYLVLIPLGAAAFKSVGRNPLAGMAAAFAGVAAGFGVNFLITPLDGVLTEITNDASALVDPEQSIDLAANLYFGIASTILVTIVLTLVSVYIVERSLGKHDPALESDDESLDADKAPEVSPEAEAKGLRYALIATAAVRRRDRPAHRVPRRTAARPDHRRHHRRLAVHGQPDPDHHDHLLRRRAGLRARSGNDPDERRGARVDHEVVGGPGEPAVSVPADRAVHRVLQLLEHGAGRGRQARRLARGGQHRGGLAADRLRAS